MFPILMFHGMSINNGTYTYSTIVLGVSEDLWELNILNIQKEYHSTRVVKFL